MGNLKTSLACCERCGKIHTELELLPFTRPVVYLGLPIATHFARCPELDEPILVMVKFQQTDQIPSPR